MPHLSIFDVASRLPHFKPAWIFKNGICLRDGTIDGSFDRSFRSVDQFDILYTLLDIFEFLQKRARRIGSDMNGIYIGTSGWVYKEWANDFYRGLTAREHFHHYATQFPTVEINATF